MTLWEAVVAGIVITGLGILIYIKMTNTNPKAANRIKDWMPKSIYDKIEEIPIPDKVEQMYDERRTML